MPQPESSLLACRAREAPVAVLDLEMTGLSPDGDRICEVAVVRAVGRAVVREYQSLVRPTVPMSPGAFECHGITAAMLADAPPFAEVAEQVAELLEGAVLISHNVPFDLGFLSREMEQAGVPLAPPPVTLDTLLIARRLFAFPRNNLGEVCRRLDVPLDRAHRALADARATFDAYHRMLEIVDPDGDVAVREIADLLGALAPNSPLRLRQQQILRDCFRELRTVWIDYQSTSDPAAGLVRREVATWVLRLPRIQGYCYRRQAERVFRLDRMRTVRRGERQYVVPPDVEPRI